MNRLKSQLVGRFNVGERVVDQETLRGCASDFVQEQVEDSGIRFDQLDITGQNYFVE